MDINELKSNWNSLKVPPEYHPDEPSDILTWVEQGRITTLRDRLGRISRMLSLVCVAGVFFMIQFFNESVTLGLLSVAFFVFIGWMHYRNYRSVCGLNFSEMTVRDAVLAVENLERSRVRLRVIGMTLGVPLVTYMTFTLTKSYGEYCMYGCIIGAVLGLAMGLLINRRSMAILREMRMQLSKE